MQTITDTMKAEAIDSVSRCYERQGYLIKSQTLISGDRWEIVYVKVTR
ncbi:MAG: hypothetical protein WKF67_06940 [Rubrobacteraceae bacterium]